MKTYIEIRCPNKKNNDRYCNHILGAITENTNESIHYCSSCNIFWNVLINKGLAVLKKIQGRINTKPIEDIYTVEIETKNDISSTEK